MSEGNIDHSFCCGVKQLVVLGQAAGPVEPRQAAFHDPALGEHLKQVLFLAFYNLDRVAKHLFCPFDQRTGVAAISEHLGDGIEAAEQPRQHRPRAYPVLNASRVDDHRQQVALRIDRNVPLAPFDLLARIVTAPPPFSAVLADCESTIATLGMVFRPRAWRPCSRNTLFTRSQVPRIRQARNCW